MRETYGKALKDCTYRVLTGGLLGDRPVYLLQTGFVKTLVPMDACRPLLED